MANNERRRISTKLNLLQGEEAPIFQVLFDLLDVVADYHDRVYNPKIKQMWVDNLIEKYKRELRKLTPEDPKQKKLDL